MTDPILTQLLAAQNTDGGWGYAPGKESRVEPTAWMIQALSDSEPQSKAVSWLLGRINDKGEIWSTPSTEPSQWTASLALLALPSQSKAFPPMASALIQQHSRVLTPPPANNPTGDVPAWGWMTNAYSWIEPTCYAVWALRTAQRAGVTAGVDARLADAKKIILARRSKDGGWNYGSTPGSEYMMESFPVPTALGVLTLVALGEKADALKTWPLVVQRVTEEPSALAHAWTIIAGRVLEQPTTEFESKLLAGWDKLKAQQNLAGALTLIALGEGWRRWA